VITHLRAVFEKTRLTDLSADHIEAYLRDRLKQRVQVKTGCGVPQLPNLTFVAEKSFAKNPERVDRQ